MKHDANLHPGSRLLLLFSGYSAASSLPFVVQLMFVLCSAIVRFETALAYDCNAILDEKAARRILPSEVTPQRDIPNIAVPYLNRTLPGNMPHIVVPSAAAAAAASGDDTYLKLFLPATLSSPGRFSCFLASLQGPVIGLMHEWLNAPDVPRAEMCRERYSGTDNDNYTQCLVNGHEDCLRGGNREPGLWQAVDPLDSIQGRLTLLLEYLDANYPDEGWEQFLEDDDDNTATYGNSTRLPRWSALWVLGHSQGAGHAAYYAQAYPLRGAGCFGGPQQNCSSPNCWTARPWRTARNSVRVLAHADEQYYDNIAANLRNTRGVFRDGFTEFYSVGNGTGPLPADLPWVTSVPQFPGATCGALVGPHCSLAVDDNAPLLAGNTTEGENPALYAYGLWQQMAGERLHDDETDLDRPISDSPSLAPSSSSSTVPTFNETNATEYPSPTALPTPLLVNGNSTSPTTPTSFPTWNGNSTSPTPTAFPTVWNGSSSSAEPSLLVTTSVPSPPTRQPSLLSTAAASPTDLPSSSSTSSATGWPLAALVLAQFATGVIAFMN